MTIHKWIKTIFGAMNQEGDWSTVAKIETAIEENLTERDLSAWFGEDGDAGATPNVNRLIKALERIFEKEYADYGTEGEALELLVWPGSVTLNGVSKKDVRMAEGMKFDSSAQPKTFYVISTENAQMCGYSIMGKGTSPRRAQADADLDRGSSDIYEQTYAVNARTMTGKHAQERYGHFTFANMCRTHAYRQHERVRYEESIDYAH